MTTTIKNDALSQLDPSLRQSSTPISTGNLIDQDAFLKMFITQLQHQDPLNPSDPDDMVQKLAAMQSVQNGVSTNEKLDSLLNQSSFSSLAGYLGKHVRLDGSEVDVKSGNGGNIGFDITDNMQSVTVELLDSEGNVKASKAFNDLAKGSHRLELDELSVFAGKYALKATGVDTSGANKEIAVFRTGLINGYTPGTQQLMLENGEEISLSDISQVMNDDQF